jgi:hypothetical protein
MKVIYELAYWQSVLNNSYQRKIPVIPYIPKYRQKPARCLETISAWQGIEEILAELLERFHLGRDRCLEFGVEHGFSTVALSSFFTTVVGVDTFLGDIHTVSNEDIFEQTKDRLAPYDNVTLIRSDYRDFIKNDKGFYDLIHVDIVHTFADTFACGLWSANHSTCSIFHDTESFPAVRQAIQEIARRTGKTFYNFEESNGLGILI